jgi:tripartite-type tricarboxylate transporter receptor subunit TctC
MELLKARTGIAPVHVPYPGNPQVITAILGAQIQAALLPPALAAAQTRSGKLRVLGSTSAGRSALVPDVPSLAEAGVKNYRLEIWNAVAAPATQPAAQVQRLSAVVAEIVRSADVRAKLVQQGWQPIGSGPDELKSRIAADTQDLGQIIREQKIQP